MKPFVSLLRGINVGGQTVVRMEALRSLYERMGLSSVRTYLQSGNVVFASDEPDKPGLAKRIEAAIEAEFGYRVPVFIRDAQEMLAIVEGNPFLAPSLELNKLHVAFLYQSADQSVWDHFSIPDTIPEKAAAGGSVIYLYYPNGAGKSKLPTGSLERKLGMPLTDRNWNTVKALYEMVAED